MYMDHRTTIAVIRTKTTTRRRRRSHIGAGLTLLMTAEKSSCTCPNFYYNQGKHSNVSQPSAATKVTATNLL